MMLFNGSGDDAGRADAITAHDEWVEFLILTGEFRFHGGGIFDAEFEDVADFDAAFLFKCRRATWASVT